LQQRVEVLNTVDELSAAIKDIWKNLSVDYIQGLYHSIPKRLRKVLKGLVLFPPNINPIIASNDHLTFVRKYNSVPLTFNSPMKLFSGPFPTLFPVNLSDPEGRDNTI
jgi:hypothetical protein